MPGATKINWDLGNPYYFGEQIALWHCYGIKLIHCQKPIFAWERWRLLLVSYFSLLPLVIISSLYLVEQFTDTSLTDKLFIIAVVAGGPLSPFFVGLGEPWTKDAISILSVIIALLLPFAHPIRPNRLTATLTILGVLGWFFMWGMPTLFYGV